MNRTINSAHKTFICLAICFAWFSTPVQSSTSLSLNADSSRVNLTPHIEWLENPNGEISIEALIENRPQDKFTSMRDSQPGLGFSNTDYWLKFSLINNSDIGDWILDQRFANTHYMDLYVVNEDNEVIKKVVTGNLRPLSTRDIPHHRLLFDLDLEKGKQIQFFIRYKSQAIIHINMMLWQKSRFIVSDHNASMIFGILYGWLILALLANAVLLLMYRRPEFFSALTFTALSSTAMMFYDGHAHLFVSEVFAPWTIYGLPLLFCCTMASLCHYWSTSMMAGASAVNQKLCRLLFLGWLAMALIAVALPYRIGLILMMFSFFVTTPYFIYLEFTGSNIRRAQDKLLLVGVSSLYIFLMLGLLYQTHRIQQPQFLEYSIHLGSVFFIMFVALSSIIHLRWMLSAHNKNSLALTNTETRLNAFLDQSTNLTSILEPNGNILEANRASLAYEDVTLHEILGKPLWQVSKFSKDSENRIRIENAVRSAASGAHSRFELNTAQDDELIFEFSFWPFYSEKNQVSAIIAEARNVTEVKNAQQKLNDICLGVSEKIGDKFFEHLVKQLAKLIKVDCVCIGSINTRDPDNIQVIAQRMKGKLEKNITYAVDNSPFKHIFEKKAHFEREGIRQKCPNFPLFADSKIESYLGIPLVNSKNVLIGVLALFDENQIEDIEKINQTLRIFISRAEAELERRMSDLELERTKQRLILHTQNTPLALIELDNELNITNWNSAASLTFGHSKEEALGKCAVELLTNIEKTDFDETWVSMLSNRNGHFSRILNTSKHGQEIICDWYNTLLIDDNGDMIGVAAFIINVTVELEAVKALRYKEQEQDEILDFMVDAVITIDEKGIVDTYNAAAVTMFGFSEEEMLGQRVSKLMPTEISGQHNQFLKRYTSTGEANILGVAREVVARKKDASSFPIRLTVAELPPNKSQRRFIATAQDLTLIKQQEEQLQRSQKMDALGTLTGGVAHDFNNLLGVIMGYADLLRNLLDDQPKLAKYSEEVLRACERGASMTKKLLAFSRQQLPNSQHCDLNSILREGKSVLERVLTPRVHIHYQLADDLHHIFIDKNDFEDAILNLSINAMHAMKQQGELNITTANIVLDEAEAQSLQLPPGDYAMLSLSDEGHGIDEATLARIFDPFFSTKGDGGTGLGLSQVYGFVERSEGKIRVASELDKGSTFTLYFPRYIDASRPSLTSKCITNEEIRGDETILLVDDERALLSVTKETLLRNGYRVLTAENGKTALELISHNSIDIMISDVIMPGMDGYQLASTVKEKYSNIKILLASGYTDNRHLEKDNEAQNFPIIHKPYESNVLLRRVRHLVDA